MCRWLTAGGHGAVFGGCDRWTIGSHRSDGTAWHPVTAFYGILGDGKTAIIEMAAASGLALVPPGRNPLATTTRGTGELITSALNEGVSTIILGRRATNDGGAGMAQAIGCADADGSEIGHGGGELHRIAHRYGRSRSAAEAGCLRGRVRCGQSADRRAAPRPCLAPKGADPAMVQRLTAISPIMRR